MSYQFLDAFGSVLTADSSIISGVVQRPWVNVGSIVGGVTFSTSSVLAYTYGMRNDAVASFLGANLTARPLMSDSAGRIITKPFAASESLIQGTSSTQGIFRTSLIGVSGAGLRNYLTDILVSNTGSVATSVSFSDVDASIIGRTIAPATSGSNIHLSSPMRTGALNSQVEYIAGTGTSTLSVSAFGYIAP